jgi:hypothetical protein
MDDVRIKKITLPGGRVVELVYFTTAEVAAGDDQRLEMCPVCGGEMVCPVRWNEVEECRWHVELRCPECEWRGTNIFDQETVDRYDDALCLAADEMIEELERMTRANMQDEIDRFVAALDADQIVPFDF